MVVKLTPRIIIISAVLGLIAVASFSTFKYLQVSRELAELKTDPARLSALLETENKKILDKLGALIQLPDENPRIVTISDRNSIINEPLLSKAEVGDAFVLYAVAKKAILYRPSQNKIIDVIPVSAPAPTVSITPSPTPRP